VDVDTADLEQKLLPTLRSAGSEKIQKDQFGKGLVEDCHNLLSSLLPFTAPEQEFLDRILDRGEMAPELLTKRVIAQRLRISPENDFAMLNRIGGDCAGAVSVLPAGESPAVKPVLNFIDLTPRLF
jgi:hypothetical protein